MKLEDLLKVFNQDKPIQFRWRPGKYANEALAAESLIKFRNAGHEDRHIFAEALISFDGKSLPKRSTNDAIMRKLERLETTINEGQARMYEAVVQALQGIDLTQYTNHETGRSMHDEIGDVVPPDVFDRMFNNVQGETFDVD